MVVDTKRINKKLTGHHLAALYNEHGSIEKVSELTGLSTNAIRMAIARAGYTLEKKYKLKIGL